MRGGTERVWLGVAALNGAVAVAAGAWASHALATDGPAQGWVRIAGQYQMWHALALVAVAVLAGHAGRAAGLAVRAAGWLHLSGTVLFSGSLYALAIAGQPLFPLAAPIGGTALILGWLALAASAALPGWRRD